MANNAVYPAQSPHDRLPNGSPSPRSNRPEADQYELKGLKGQLARRLFQLVAEFGSAGGHGSAAGRA